MTDHNKPLTHDEMRYMIGIRFHALRLDMGLNQTDTAALLDIPRSTLSSIERGKMLPNMILANRIMRVYRAPLDFLFTGKGLDRKLTTKWGTFAQRKTIAPTE